MKKISILILLAAVIALSSCTPMTPEVKSVVGEYNITADCYITQMSTMEDYTEQHTYDINIKKNNQSDSDIKFFMPKHGINSDVKCKTTGDNRFNIIKQEFTSTDRSEYLSGDGQVVGDSIFMYYVVSSANSEGILHCNCKGKKLKTSGSMDMENE